MVEIKCKHRKNCRRASYRLSVIGGKMFKELIYNLLFKSLEIVLVAILGYFVFILLEQTFSTIWAIIGLTEIFYFFSAIIAPYINQLRKWIYAKITGIDEEDFK